MKKITYNRINNEHKQNDISINEDTECSID